uniref:VAN3-binding protein-like auxin canalisation domain-containing protein n=1 Tax=Oryza meridionalis TaxID=40149 RepID=A0A0E0EPG4_9ORYZ
MAVQTAMTMVAAAVAAWMAGQTDLSKKNSHSSGCVDGGFNDNCSGQDNHGRQHRRRLHGWQARGGGSYRAAMNASCEQRGEGKEEGVKVGSTR